MHDRILKNWLDSSFLTKNNQAYIDQIYEDFLKNPSSVDVDWQTVFQQWFVDNKINDQLSSNLKSENISDKKITDHYEITEVIIKILQLINSFRLYGHQYADLDPLKSSTKKNKNDFLELKYYNFSKKNFYQKFDMTLLGFKEKNFMTIKEIYTLFKTMYSGNIGIEYMHILDTDQVLWIQNNFESRVKTYNIFSVKEKIQFLTEIIAAEGLERYLGVKFPGVKRFSLEGCDVLIPMLKEIIRNSVLNYNVQEIFLGMAHRGRLNTLINVLGKNPQDLFNEFYDKNQIINKSGDVKYHQGLHSEITINNRTVHLSLLSNPSHLEIVTPVVMGCARAKIDQLINSKHQIIKNNEYNIKNTTILSISIHGDAAISAQGVVQESFNMANTRAYSVNGTIHIVINNQIGFTTSNIKEIRSTLYCTDIAKMIQAPILHVNADDIDAVIFATHFALNFRNKFKTDIIIDLICYRRHGHNETDEPSVTQPIMYQKIYNHPTVKNIYSNILIQNGMITSDKIKEIELLYRSKLEKENCLIEDWIPINTRSVYCLHDYYECKNQNHFKKINKKHLQELAYHINSIPIEITMHERVKKIYNERLEMALGKRLFDWGGAEILAYAVLLDQGYSIRLSGEDVARGTFFHRHAIIYDQKNEMKYIPLTNIKDNQGLFFIWNSVLSEESTLAFEYGYSNISINNTLVIWEAQFGDFSNGAQIVIDQFISSSEQKWNQLSGLTILLPHGYEGQGPEHSSCRIERYLQLCAENNMRICVPSNPAQIYHLIHQQAKSNMCKPLIIVSPKSLLRNTLATSSIEDLAYGSFKTVFDEINSDCISNQIDKIIICTGKIYYDLINQRNQTKKYNIAIIRIEQLYPFPYSDIKIILNSYKNIKKIIWCQEEPKNQGAWYYIQRCFYEFISNIQLNYIGRSESAAPAVGYFSLHKKQQNTIINDALDLI